MLKQREFRDWSEYLALARTVDTTGISFGSWHGCNSWSEALGLADRGWPEGMAQVRAGSLPQVESMSGRLTAPTGWGWDVTGAAYDVGEYLAGTPECWLTPAVSETKPVVRIGVDIVLSGGIDADVICRRGCALVALVMALQAAGYVVDIAAHAGMSPGHTTDVWLRIPLVDINGGPLDADRLAFALMHPAAVRALSYNVGAYVGTGSADRTGLGWPSIPDPWAESCDLYLRGLRYDEAKSWRSDAEVAQWVEAQFKKLTGPAMTGKTTTGGAH